jgi:drug/metabolite transporter (DMT)-like permease
VEFHLVALVLFAALVHASWNAVVKSSGDRVLTFTAIHLTGTALGTVAIFFVGLPDAHVWPYLLVSALVHNLYYVFLLLSYKLGDLSEVYPIARGSSPLMVALGAMVVAGEVPTVMGFGGIALVSLGIISLTFAGGKPTRAGMRPLLAALCTGVLISSYTVLDGLGMRAGASPWPYIVWLNFLEGIPFGLYVLACRRADVAPFLAGNWKPALAGGCLTTIAYGIALFALTQGGMAHVSALRETSVLFAAIIGSLILKEGFGRARIISALVITVGIVVLLISG